MITCERCGADAVDEDGLCQHCGWRAPAGEGDAFGAVEARDSSPSLGETRAVDAPAVDAPTPIGRRAAPLTPTQRDAETRAGQSGAVRRPFFDAGLPPVPASAPTNPATGRYCGTCGARMEAGRAFCGQCGTPTSTGSTGTSADTYGWGGASGSEGGRYRRGDDPTWSPHDGDAPTEAALDLPLPFAPGYGGAYRAAGRSYDGSGYGSSYGAMPRPAPRGAPEASRTLRMALGVVCLAGSAVSAIIAILLATLK